MSKILAPSNVGYKDQKHFYEAFWSARPAPPTTRVTGNPIVMRSYKGPTQRSDGRAPTNYSRMIAKVVPGGGAYCFNNFYNYKADGYAEGVSWNPHGSQIFSGFVGCPTWMTDKVILDALADMNQLDANILEDLGQLRETGKMIADIFRLMVDLFRMAKAGAWSALRKALRGAGVSVPRNVAKGWLVYFYGIKPLVSTIEALVAADEPLFKTFSVRKRVSQNVSALPYFNGSYWHQFSGSAKIQAQCEISASIKLASNLATWQRLGLTSSRLTDVVVTAYALVPYSFVLDWFIPIEAWLRSLVWSPFLEYQGGYTGKRHYVHGSVKNMWPWSGSWPYSGVLPEFTLMVRFYQRTTYPYKVPSAALGIRLSLSPTQIVSASALLTAAPRL